MSNKTNLVARYSASERINHWLVAITFVMLAFSGLALFHPAFFFLTNLFGGGSWTRILHPFIGVVMFVSFLGLIAKFIGQNHITKADLEWQKHLGDIMANKAKNLPEIGKYNIGQKYLFWSLVVIIPLLMLSGFIIWRPYFALYFPVDIIRVAVLVHAVAAFLAIMTIIVHVYAAIWTKGSIRAMTRGTVTTAWARHHHPAWYKEISRENKL
ncbi:MAG: formate dehydrogenase subunit gamma [Sulfuriferula sp.]|nr:formate dehydrogenase subunit gamma [Sulfuriferula sp.]